MVFLPLPAYHLSKLLLNIDSGRTLITLISSYKSENSVSLRAIPNRKDSTREMTCCTYPTRPIHAHKIRSLPVQTSHFITQISFYVGYFIFS